MNERGYRVLVVEDEVLLLESLTEKVRDADLGFQVSATANNGRIAMQLIDESPPDVVITDIRMPLMDGLELVKWMDAEHTGISKIIVSGYSDFEYARAAIRYNVQDYLLKPVSMEELRNTLLRVGLALDQSRSAMDSKLGAPPGLTLDETVKFLRESIRERFCESLDIGALVAGLHYSPDYINRLFVRKYMETPTKYLIHLRMNEAKNLLLSHKELSVKQVAEAVGYEDQSYFSRLFKKHTGVSPLDFREGAITE